MEVTLRAAVDPARFRVEALSAAGDSLVFDVGEVAGGGVGWSPTDGVLAALAACTAMDVAAILRKKRQRARRYEIAIVAEKAEDHPRVFTSIMVEHRVGGDVEAEALRRSVELSATRYCPVNAMLSRSVQIEHRYRLLMPGGTDLTATVVIIGPGQG